MKDERKTKKQLIAELTGLRQQLAEANCRVAELEPTETERARSEEERGRADTALRESEDRYHTLFERVPTGLYRTTPDGQILDANAALAEILGFPDRETALMVNVFEAYANPEDRARWQALMEPEGMVRDFEAQWRRRDGTVIWAKESARVVRDDNGQVLYYEGTLEDITERVHSEEERRKAGETMRESEEKFRTLAEQSPNMIFISRGSSVVYANERSEDVMGYTRDEFYSPDFDFLSLIAPEYEGLVKSSFGRHTRGEEIAPYEYALITKDGRRIEAIITTRLIEYEGDRAILGIVTDITERRLVEERLCRREQEFKTLVENNPDMIARFDRECRHIYVNPAVERELGISPQDLLGKTHRELGMSAEQVEWSEEIIRQVFESGQETVFETSIPTDEGVKHYLTRGVPEFAEDGSVISALFIHRDVTERVRSEEEQAQAEEMLRQSEERLQQQERLAAIGQLAGGIAHDFNNLLAAITLYAQILKGKPHLPPDLASSVDAILEESRRAAELVQKILDFGRRAMMEARTVDLAPHIEGAMGVLQRTLPETVKLVLETEAGVPMVKADPLRIQQALMNLAANARDAMPEGGELRISLSSVEIGMDESPPLADMDAGRWVCLAVSDTGVGMMKEVQDHLFEPFFTTKPVGEGTGLGLAQAYGIVKQHGGQIGVETEAGKGTVLRIYLPAHRQGGLEQTTAEMSAPPRGQGETILLVEDREELREAGRSVLESLGYRVLTATDGREALQTYRSVERVDLVITDVAMPDMGGRELVQELRKADPYARALAITGYALSKRELREEGFLDVVQKPFNLDELAMAVRRALDAKRETG